MKSFARSLKTFNASLLAGNWRRGSRTRVRRRRRRRRHSSTASWSRWELYYCTGWTKGVGKHTRNNIGNLPSLQRICVCTGWTEETCNSLWRRKTTFRNPVLVSATEVRMKAQPHKVRKRACKNFSLFSSYFRGKRADLYWWGVEFPSYFHIFPLLFEEMLTSKSPTLEAKFEQWCREKKSSRLGDPKKRCGAIAFILSWNLFLQPLLPYGDVKV